MSLVVREVFLWEYLLLSDSILIVEMEETVTQLTQINGVLLLKV